jgi:hypothetical protein
MGQTNKKKSPFGGIGGGEEIIEDSPAMILPLRGVRGVFHKIT